MAQTSGEGNHEATLAGSAVVAVLILLSAGSLFAAPDPRATTDIIVGRLIYDTW